MNALTKFDFTAGEVVHEVGVVSIDGAPWFVVTHACRALDFYVGARCVNTTMAISRLDEDEKRKYPTNLIEGGRTVFYGAVSVMLISESGLYKLIMRSDKPSARPFQDWVTKEVLPPIRKTGRYDVREAPKAPPPLPIELTDYRAQFAEIVSSRRTRDGSLPLRPRPSYEVKIMANA